MKKWPVQNEALRAVQALHHAGRLDEARQRYFQLLAQSPDSAEILISIAILEHQCDHNNQAIRIAQEALLVEPNHPLLLMQLGDFLLHDKNLDGALQAYENARRLAPQDAEPLVKLGQVHERAGRNALAGQCYQSALNIQPHNIKTICALGGIISMTHGAASAIAFLQQALAQNPQASGILNHLGSQYAQLQELDQAVSHTMQALALQPDFAEAYDNLGVVLMLCQRTDEAIEAFQSAVHYKPNFPTAHITLGTALLGRGDYAQGWAEYEWRWQRPGYFNPCRQYPQPVWDGSDPRGRTILVHAEQGLGDTLQLLRYARVLHGHGATVAVQCQPSLCALLAEQAYISRAVAEETPPGAFDVSTSILSLPHLTRLPHPAQAGPLPYIHSRAHLPLPEPVVSGLRVGIRWQGTLQTSYELRPLTRRSTPLEAWEPLLANSAVQFYSLQRDATPAVDLSSRHGGRIVDLEPLLGDFSATAALMRQLDLIITIDTSIAHLAGAMGLNTWTILPPVADWRWGEKGETCDWYPDMRLFRLREPGAWRELMEELARRLAGLAAQR